MLKLTPLKKAAVAKNNRQLEPFGIIFDSLIRANHKTERFFYSKSHQITNAIEVFSSHEYEVFFSLRNAKVVVFFSQRLFALN